MYKFETVIGSQTEKPAEIDTTSSEYVVYIRRNIKEYHSKDQGVEFNGWKYEECIVPNNDYLVNFVKQLVEENQELKDQNEALMMGLVDIYEQNLGV